MDCSVYEQERERVEDAKMPGPVCVRANWVGTGLGVCGGVDSLGRPRGDLPLALYCGPSTEALEVGPQEPSVAPSYSDHITLWKPTTLYISCLTWRLGWGQSCIWSILGRVAHLLDPKHPPEGS